MTKYEKIEELEYEMECLHDQLMKPKCEADFRHNYLILSKIGRRKRLIERIKDDALNAPYRE
tara:strand:- start:412 stop:597 length:186 start_codon:yes stop_codon:yes gene_type:complete